MQKLSLFVLFILFTSSIFAQSTLASDIPTETSNYLEINKKYVFTGGFIENKIHYVYAVHLSKIDESKLVYSLEYLENWKPIKNYTDTIQITKESYLAEKEVFYFNEKAILANVILNKAKNIKILMAKNVGNSEIEYLAIKQKKDSTWQNLTPVLIQK